MMRNRLKSGSASTATTTKEADAAAGMLLPLSATARENSVDDLFEEMEPVLVLGVDISHLSRQKQFAVCAAGVFFFSLLYGYLQELISVHICNRQLGLFLAVAQFSGYTAWSFILRNYVSEKKQQLMSNNASLYKKFSVKHVPFLLYLGLSILRAIDLGMTNLAMQYVNYPAKTLMKSSRVVFTMMFGVIISRKRYRMIDYVIVLLMVSGLAIFMHADANSSAVFNSMGIIMLTTSLMCDGAISNMSETVMNQYGVGQDEFIFRLYSIALIAITAAAAAKGDLLEGVKFLSQPGTYDEILSTDAGIEKTWSVASKWLVLILFSTMGFFGSSCSAAITKHFGALTMSITSTARKATTLFLSFALFDNECTMEHIFGVILFISSLVWKSYSKSTAPVSKRRRSSPRKMQILSGASDLELVQQSMPFITPNDSGTSSAPLTGESATGYHVV